MQHRDELSRKIEKIVDGEESPSMTNLESWLYHRRSEWAGQLIDAKVQENVVPDASLADVLKWALIRSWHSDGCIALWNNAERGGKPHPEATPNLFE